MCIRDRPGTYALSAYTPEERYVRSHIAERTPDVIINSVEMCIRDRIDAQRSLYQSQMEFVNLVAQQYINYVNLCKALGGGW